MLFSGVRYAISSTLPTQRQSELAKLLDANGAAMVELAEATHVVSNTLQFDGREMTTKDMHIVTDEWVDRSIVHGKLQDTKLFSADPLKIFSGVVACASDLEACDKEVIAAGINALGGLFREGYTRDCTHVLAPRAGSDKYLTAMHYASATRVRVVLPHWFDDCFKLLVRLPEEPYAWPDPPLLRSGYSLTKARLAPPAKALVKAAVLEDEPVDKIAALVHSQSNIWQGKRVLLSSALSLADGRRGAVEASVQRAGGLPVQLSDDEMADIDSTDVYITQHRIGAPFVKAIRANKIVGTLSWLFNVHKSGIITPPRDQLVHFPTYPTPVAGFEKHKVTATNYEGDARRYLKKLIELMGGEFTPQMTVSNTVVVAAFINGEKTTKAREWDIPVVNHMWLEDCFAAWMLRTPAQEKYVSFPPGVNFGVLVATRGAPLLTEEELVEIERASEEERKKKEEALLVQARMDVDNEAGRLASESPSSHRVQRMSSSNKKQGGSEKRNSQASPSKPTRAEVISGRKIQRQEEEEEEDEEVEEDEEEEEELHPRRGRGRPPKRTRESDEEDESDAQTSRGRGRVSPAKRVEKSRTGEDEESEDKDAPRRPGRSARKSSVSKKATGKTSAVDSEIESEKEDYRIPRLTKSAKTSPAKVNQVDDESDEEPSHRVGRLKASKTTKKQIAKGAIMTASPRSKATATKARSTLALLDDDEFSSSSDDGLSPIRPSQGTAVPPPPTKRGKAPKFRVTDVEEEEEEEDHAPKAPTKSSTAHSRRAQNAAAGPSKPHGTIPQNQKTPVRKQPSLPGPTPGRSVFVEISSPQKSSASLDRVRSVASVDVDDAALYTSPKRVRPGPRTRAPNMQERENESPLSSSGTPADSPPRSSRFGGDAVRRSSQPTPIISTTNLQRTPSRRQAASKANVKLHENALDINKFEKEKRSNRVRGAWENGIEKAKLKVEPKADESRKRRVSAVQPESDMEEPNPRSKKKRKSDGGENNERRAEVVKKGKKSRASTSVSVDEEDEPQGSGNESGGDALDGSDIRLLTTQVTLSDQILKGLRQLGVKMASKPTECNLLLANNIGRTEKFLCAMATARSIVTEDWATDSVKAKRILPPDNYFLKDPEGEKKHKFKLVDALRRAQSSGRLLEGQTFYLTKGLHRSEKLVTYKNVIHSAGGKVVLANPTVRILKGHKDRHVLSVEGDNSVTDVLQDEGFHIYVAEFILVGVLTQRMDWDTTQHRLDTN